MKTDKLINEAILKSLSPINELGPDVIKELASNTYFETLSEGEFIFTAGTNDPWVYYLISGECKVIIPGGSKESVVGGTAESKQPLLHSKPRRASVMANSSIIFIRVKDDYVKGVLVDAALPENEKDDTVKKKTNRDDDEESGILNEINRDAKSDRLVIPSLPEVAIKVREAVQQPDSDAEKIAKLILTDPPLAARIIQVANSPVYRGQTAITNCRAAVSRMGMQVTKDLIVGCSLQQMFESDSPELKKRMKETWERSTYVGAISAILAGLSPKLDADRAMLAGLLHNVGALSLLAYGKNYPRLLSDNNLMGSVIDKMSAKVGAIILKKWQFDSDMIDAVQYARDWMRDEEPSATYSDVVILAQLYSYIDTDKMDQYPAIDEVPAFKKLPLGRMGPQMTIKVLETSHEKIKEIQSILQG